MNQSSIESLKITLFLNIKWDQVMTNFFQGTYDIARDMHL